jgi:serine/threonine protein kinase
VYQAINHVTGEILAVKEVVASKSRIRAASALRIELDTLRQLRHANIVRYRGMFEREDSLCVAMEYCPGGSLSSVLAKFGVLDDDVARNYTGQILCGLEYLHRHCIVHR